MAASDGARQTDEQAGQPSRHLSLQERLDSMEAERDIFEGQASRNADLCQQLRADLATLREERDSWRRAAEACRNEWATVEAERDILRAQFMCESDECQFIGPHELTECCPGGEHLAMMPRSEAAEAERDTLRAERDEARACAAAAAKASGIYADFSDHDVSTGHIEMIVWQLRQMYDEAVIERDTLKAQVAALTEAQAPKWSAEHDQDELCACGHRYERHFDTYENMLAVGCKYCECATFQRAALPADAPPKPVCICTGLSTGHYPECPAHPNRATQEPTPRPEPTTGETT